MKFWRMRPLEWKVVRPGCFEASFREGYAMLKSEGKRKPWRWFLRFGQVFGTDSTIYKGEAKSKKEATEAVAAKLEEVVADSYLEPAERDTDCGNSYRYPGIQRPRCSGGMGCDACWRKYVNRRVQANLAESRLQKVKS